MINFYIAAFLSLSFSSFISTAQIPIVVAATNDNTIYSELPGNSFGAGDNFTVGTTAGMGIRRGLIRFDLSTLPAGATIISATMNLTMNKTVSGAVDISLYSLTKSWGEGTSNVMSDADGQGAAATSGDATWVCSFAVGGGGCVTTWTTMGGDFIGTASATSSVNGTGNYGWSSSQMVADIQGWLNSPATNFGWIIRSAELTPGTAKRFDSRSSPATSARPSLSITYTNVVPVSLLYFKAQSQKYGTLLKWETEQEFNNEHFVVEHSLDGRRFTPIGQVKGAGNSATPVTYQYIHQVKEPGRHFYRLVQVDINNARHYSSITSVESENASTALLVSPNPVLDKINLPGFSGNGNKYQVININGQKLLEGSIFGSQVNLNGSINSGLYQLIIYTADRGIRTTRFLKQ